MRVVPPSRSASPLAAWRVAPVLRWWSSRPLRIARTVSVAAALLTAAALVFLHSHGSGHRVTAVTSAGEDVRLSAESDRNPSRSRPPGPDFVHTCIPSGSGYHGLGSACDKWAAQNINRARRSEGLRDLDLPADFTHETLHSQLVTLVDDERTSRGLPGLDQTVPLDHRAASAADAETDPTGPAGKTWVSNWAGGYRTPLAADYGWMYDDGLGGTNADCRGSNHSGCWAHRDNILANFRGTMGASQVQVGRWWSATELLVRG